MSLLLDALKKAAEQKAEKNRQESPEAKSSDQTAIDAAPEDITELGDFDENTVLQTRRNLQDETEVDDSEFNTQLESTRVEPEDGTETQLDASDNTETETHVLSAQMQTGEDETIIFAEEDVTAFMGDSELVGREVHTQDDETDLSQPAPREDETVVTEMTQQLPEDETDLSQRVPGEDETVVTEMTQQLSEDETDLSQQAPGEDGTLVTEMTQQVPEDDTDISQPFPVAEEVPPTDAEDETDISVPSESVADLEHVQAQQAASREDTDIGQDVTQSDDTGVFDEDMSLLLVEHDQTNLTSPTSATDPQVPEEQIQALREDSGGDEELALVDTTLHRAPPEVTATQASTTATTGIALDTQTGATTRTEATSTRTYAPDNYDRTLMRLPSDDASKLFAGMKSDSDVVMTPEYAKKVFRSKMSAQRLQHYKFYSGIAVVILLAIAIFGLFEYQDQSNSIDNSLRALKRDPMPGIIKPAEDKQSGSLFAEVEVDERTLGIIESATDSSAEPAAGAVVSGDEPEPAGSVDEVADELESSTEIEVASEAESSAVTEMAMIENQPAATVETAPRSSSAAAQTDSESQSKSDAPATAGGSTTLEISSSERVEQKHIWLREAYSAYQAGNDELAMSLYNKVLEIDPGNRNALLARAAIHVQNNDSNAAIRDYQKLLLNNPKDSLAMASLITVANYSPRETETQLKLMIRDEPGSPYLNFVLANAYGAQDRWQEAQQHYFTALENNPNDPNYAYNLAVSLEHLAKPRAAIAYYRRALDNLGNGLATFNKDVVDQRLEILGKL